MRVCCNWYLRVLLSQVPGTAGIKGCVDLVHFFKTPAVLGPFRRFQFAHVFAMFGHRNYEEAGIPIQLCPFAFLPECGKIGFQLSVAADMVHGVIAFVGIGIDLLQSQAAGQVADTVKDQVLGTVTEKGLGETFDDFAAVLRILHGADPYGIAAFFRVGPEPEHDLV